MIRKTILAAILLAGYMNTDAQDAPVRTPEEQRQLFNYCDKPELIKKYKISAEAADKIGDLNLWATQQQKAIDANTNETFATAGELEQELTKKYKALKLSDEQAKGAVELRRERVNNSASCPIITLTYNNAYDTLTPQRALQLFKTKWRKMLIDKLGPNGNGRQADMLFETEVWKQKESLAIAKIPVSDFNRVQRTVSMHRERENKYKAIGLTEDQIDPIIQFFNEHQLYPR